VRGCGGRARGHAVVALADSDSIAKLLYWGAVGVAGLVLLALVAWWSRRRLLGASDGQPENLLDMEALERLRAAGAISEPEFRMLRSAAMRALTAEHRSGRNNAAGD